MKKWGYEDASTGQWPTVRRKDQSATTIKAGGMRQAPGWGQGFALLMVADLVNITHE